MRANGSGCRFLGENWQRFTGTSLILRQAQDDPIFFLRAAVHFKDWWAWPFDGVEDRRQESSTWGRRELILVSEEGAAIKRNAIRSALRRDLLEKLTVAELIIEAGRTEGQYWHDLWRYRELFYVLAWRDIAVRYKQTVIGVGWALLQPFINTILLTVVFQYFAQMKSTGSVPYPLLVFAGSMPWQFFTSSLGGTSASVVTNANLISKVYFPRLIVPAAAVVTSLADLLISFLLLLTMMAWYHYLPSPRIVLLPVFILLGFCAALGPGLLFTALTVKYKDFRIITPFVVQIGALASPVGYSTAYAISKLQLSWHLPFNPLALYCLNPMVSVIEGFRWCILGGPMALDPASFFLSVDVTIFLMLLGIWYFRKTEKSFADVI